MRTKKARKPSLPMQYVLSFDKGLKKISLRKLSASFKRAAKSARRARQTMVRGRAKGRSRRTVHAYAPWTPSWRAIALVLIGGMTGVALFADHRTASSGVADRRLAAEVDVESVAAPSQVMPAIAKAQPAAQTATAVVMPEAAEREEGWVTGDSIASLQEAPTVSITGCLERGGDNFWLSETAGDAPRSRSWKSGFLRKRSSRIDINDAGHTLMLSSYVGDRVTATGSLVDRELEVRSVRRASGACER
jgi:hypothetical protein